MPTIDSRKVRRDLRYTWGVHDDEIIIGTVVRFDKQKAPEILLGAFANIAKRIDNVRLVMVGGGPVNQKWSDEIGADGYAETAEVAVQLALRLIDTKN